MIFKILQILGINTSDYNRALVHFAGLKHPHSLWMAAALLALFAVTAYFMVKPLLSLRRKMLILVLHGSALAAALVLFLQPEIRLAVAEAVKSPVAILIDSSESMSVSSENGQSRLKAAEQWLEKNRAWFEALSQDFELKWFSFDEKLTALPGYFPEQPALKASGQDTRILESVSSIRREFGNKPLSGVIVLSDGADHAALAQGNTDASDARKKFSQELKKNLSGLGRIYPVLAGSELKLKDLALVKLEHDSYGFIKNPFVVSATVRALGDIPRQSSLQLWQEDKLISTRPVILEPGKEQKFELEFVPQEVGRFLFRVELPVYPGEASVENNQRSFPLTIIRDRIRVLYIVGNPSWDEKFLRQTLRKNPAVDLVSFYILREYFDDPAAPEEELALIPFPTHKLFTEELASFDLVIFQNFFGQPYMLPSYIQNLRDYVKDKGGALIYIGGPRSFLKEPFEAPLEEILPVDFAFAVPNYKPDRFKLRLTETGARHPITRLESDDFQNRKLWESLGEFQGFNQLLRAKQDSLVLVDTKNRSNPAMIAVREPGKGRVMSIATDNLWRWHFQTESIGSSSRYYQLFWERALRWLMRDPEMKPVSLSSVREYSKPGEEVSLFFQVQDVSYEPVSGASVLLSAIKAPPHCGVENQAGAEISPGKYQFRFKLDCPGGYRFQASAQKAGRALGSDQEVLVVQRESAEMDDLLLHPELLQSLAEASGGKMLGLDQAADKIKFDKLELEEITSATDLPLWDNWLWWTILVALFSLAWGLRRYWGLS